MNAAHLPATREIWVCCAITSETRMPYGSLEARNGKVRPLESNHSRTAACASGGSESSMPHTIPIRASPAARRLGATTIGS